MAVSDAYSTICNMTLEKRTFNQFMPLASVDTTIPVMIEDDLPDANVSILGCFVTIGGPTADRREKGDVTKLPGAVPRT